MSNFSISPGNSYWIPAFVGMTANKKPRPGVVIPAKAGIQGIVAKYDLPQLIENLR